MINYYVVLEIPNFSEEPVIKKAYRALSKKYHPDVNKDPLAHDYFLKVNEAYDFLMNQNKRLLLNQFLRTAVEKKIAESFFNENYSQQIKPVIHLFKTDRKTFSLHDYILIQWNVSQCKAVHLNILGNVAFSGSHYLRVEEFVEEIKILMTVTAFDDAEYKYQITLKYFNENPAVQAFHEMLAKNPQTKSIHFKEERFFDTHARIGKNVFKNRMFLLLIFLAATIFLFVKVTPKHFVFLLLLFNLWVIYAQCLKRIHDISALKNNWWSIWIPVYNLWIFYKLFVLESEPNANEFGMIPQQTKASFGQWIKKNIQKTLRTLSVFHKISLGSFLVLMAVVTAKYAMTYREIDVELTSHYVETSRPTTNGHVEKSYYLEFENIPIQVTELEYRDIVGHARFRTFKMGLNKKNEAQYIHVINQNTQEEKRLGFGVLGNANPILLIISLIFLGQIYACKNLRKPSELPYANAYMIFAMLVYLLTFLMLI